MLLNGCSVMPFTADQVLDYQLRTPAMRAPVRNVTSTEVLLACVGDRMRDARVAPVLVSWGVDDTTNKTGVHLGTVLRSTLNKVASRGSGLSVTSMGVAPVAGERMAYSSAEERLRERHRAKGDQLSEPDWIIEGGVTSVVSQGLVKQRSAGLSAMLLDGGLSRSTSLDEIRLSFHIKRYADGVDIPGAAVDLKVVIQQAGVTADVGALLVFRAGGHSNEVGLRFGWTDGTSESAEDAIRVGTETAVAMLLAQLNGIDLAVCPGQPAASAVPSLLERYFALAPKEQIRRIQSALAARGYEPGPTDGVLRPQTQAAIRRFEQDAALPPSDGRPGAALYVALKEAEPAGANPGALHIALSNPLGEYAVQQTVQAQVLPYIGGWINCYLIEPDGRVMSAYPIFDQRPTFSPAGRVVSLPSPYPSGPQPTIRVERPGAHALYCAASRQNITNKLPASLRPGKTAYGLTLAELRRQVRTSVGAELLSDASAPFRGVVPKKK